MCSTAFTKEIQGLSNKSLGGWYRLKSWLTTNNVGNVDRELTWFSSIMECSADDAEEILAELHDLDVITLSGSEANVKLLYSHAGKKEKCGEYTAEFEEAWEAYPPSKSNKKQAFRKYQTTVKKGATPGEILLATKNYAISRIGQDKLYTKHMATFLGPDEHWRDFLQQQEEPVQAKEKPLTKEELWKLKCSDNAKKGAEKMRQLGWEGV